MRCVRADGRLRFFVRRVFFTDFLPALAFLPFLPALEGVVAVLALWEVEVVDPRCFCAVSSADCPAKGVMTISAASKPAVNRARTGAEVGEIAALIVSLYARLAPTEQS